jgi:hypothetical protein
MDFSIFTPSEVVPRPSPSNQALFVVGNNYSGPIGPLPRSETAFDPTHILRIFFEYGRRANHCRITLSKQSKPIRREKTKLQSRSIRSSLTNIAHLLHRHAALHKPELNAAN